jgi:hypothetical protein
MYLRAYNRRARAQHLQSQSQSRTFTNVQRTTHTRKQTRVSLCTLRTNNTHTNVLHNARTRPLKHTLTTRMICLCTSSTRTIKQQTNKRFGFVGP